MAMAKPDSLGAAVAAGRDAGLWKVLPVVRYGGRVSTGTPWPDGSHCERGSVLFITAEDDPGDTIRPRLDAHRADVSRIHLLAGTLTSDKKGEDREIRFTLQDVGVLEATLDMLPDCRLIVIDPIGSFLGGRTDAHRDNQVRGVLAPVAGVDAMASLQRITDAGRDCYRLRFYIDRRRKTLGLGSMDEPAATEAKAHVEHLIDLVGWGRPPVTATLRWLDGLPGSIHDRLAAMGLCEPRKRCELPRSVLAFMRAYIASRTDWKKPENYRQAVNHLAKYLGRDAPIGALTKGDAERWHRWLMDRKVGPGLSPNTAGSK